MMVRFAVIPVLLALLAPASVLPGAEKRVRAADFRITRQLTAWHEIPGSLVLFTPQTLFDLIDGGAPEYNDRGLKEGFLQRLAGPDSVTVETYVMDFGNAEKANAMFQARQPDSVQRILLEGFEASSAAAIKMAGAFCAYAVVDRFYVETTLTGCANLEKAVKSLQSILGLYRARTGKQKQTR